MFDYKKIFRSRKTRERIMRLLNFLPDKTMIKLEYKIKTGRKLNLKKPERYTEKIQWYKLYYRVPLMAQITDKYEVREYVKTKGLDSILNECYGVYNYFDEIDFNALPNQFVIKDTLGSGSVSVIVVKDKSKMDMSAIKAQVEHWLSKKNEKLDDGREWAYHAGKKHRIIIEKFLTQPEEDLVDFKFMCFGGKPYCVVHDKDRFDKHKRTYFDLSWNKLDAKDRDYPICEEEVTKPDNWEQMIEIATRLSEDFPAIRVDLYNISGRIYFGELTCYPHSGLVNYEPESFDFELGKQFVLPERTIK